jgi:ATP-binding cassette, subfamily B, bacterial
MADQIIVLDRGRVIEQGSHAQLMEQNGRYAHLFTLQAEGYR